MNLKLKKPCKNCPFLSATSTIGRAIDLHPGRVKQIATDLIKNDREPFLCHKTLSGEYSDGDFEDEEGCESPAYRPGERDSICAGSMVFLLKAGAPNVAMRMGAALGLLSFEDLRAQFDEVINPKDVLGE
jgi:hypothetical protein